VPNYETIRAQMVAAIPFVRHVGIALVEIAPGKAVATLDQSATSINHIGSQHAGALFTLGETASGAALAGTFAELLGNIRPLAANASIDYKKLARGTITATAVTNEDPAVLLATLQSDKKVVFDIAVTLVDASGVTVGAMSVNWQVRLG
jgi:acyl-coenzyme A thioesterase PaaI-like protein